MLSPGCSPSSISSAFCARGCGAKTFLTIVGEPRSPHFVMSSTPASCALHFTIFARGFQRVGQRTDTDFVHALENGDQARQAILHLLHATFRTPLNLNEALFSVDRVIWVTR